MNTEAIEWLEDQPLDFEAGYNHYGNIQDRHARDLCDEGAEEDEFPCIMPVIQTEFFSFKNDHEYEGRYVACHVCRGAKKAGTLIVVGGKNE